MTKKQVKKTPATQRKLVCEETFEIKNSAQGVTIQGFANKATVDRGDEVIAVDAWELDNYRNNPIILFNHGMDTLGGTPVGKAIDIKQTKDGLFLKVKMSNSQAPGIKMVRELVEERILRAFSVGFSPKQTDTIDRDGRKIKLIKKAELFEVSIVGVPMNQDSLFELSEKSLTTKSMHQLKSEFLKATGAEKAAAIEAMIPEVMDRKAFMQEVAKVAGVDLLELLDMLSGTKEVTDEVHSASESVVKASDLKETLEAALSALAEGVAPEEVAASLADKLSPGESSEQTEEAEDQKKPKEGEGAGEEGEGAGEGIEGADLTSEAEESGSPKDKEDADKLKQDFQSCVEAMVPKLLEEGMEQDAAVAQAISKCQESGKCQLTPESKLAVFEVMFKTSDDQKGAIPSEKFQEAVSFTKQVDEQAQTEQPPSTPVKTEPNQDDFGSPFLEAAKQTNVLLGALINEIQMMSNKLDGLSQSNSVQSENDQPKVSTDESEDESKSKAASEELAVKMLASLNQRLQNLGY